MTVADFDGVRRIVIVGGVAGGMSAATRLRRLDERAEIVVLERGEHVSFANCGLPYHLSGVIAERERLLLHTPQSLSARFGLDVRTRQEVRRIDRAARQVEVHDLQASRSYTLSYDHLILSPGAAPVRPPIPGAQHALTLRNVSDLDRLKSAAVAGQRSVVIGGGFIGVEVAENLREAGHQVTLLEGSPQILPPLDPELAVLARQELEKHGVQVRCSAQVTQLTERSVTLHSGETLDTDLVVLAVGVRPEDGLARDAGLEVAGRGGIVVDESLLTSDPHISAVGDAALVRDPLGELAFVPLAWGANRQGRLVADRIMGHPVSFGGHPATAIVKVFDLTAASTGLNEKQVAARGLPYATVHTHPGSHAGYYPGAERVSLKLVFDPQSGRIYGAQAVGGAGTDKRIDVLATALHAGLHADDLSDLPLAYAPPYSSAKDPVNMLGYVAQNVMDGLTRTVQWHELEGSGRRIIDVRDPSEYARGRIPGAENIPLDDLRSRADELRGTPLVVHCQVGQRGHTAARLLTELGCDVPNLDGGYLTWQAGQASRDASPQS